MNDYLGDVDIDTGIRKTEKDFEGKELTYNDLAAIIFMKIKDEGMGDEIFKISMPTSDMFGQFVGLTFKDGQFLLS